MNWPTAVCLLLLLVVASGCASVQHTVQQSGKSLDSVLTPSNHRNWKPVMSRLPTADISRERVTVRNVRHAKYLSETDYVLDYYDKTFQLEDLTSVDFLFVPFQDAPSLAHTMLSFGLKDQSHIVVSAEVRLEENEKYSPVLGALRRYELMYVVGDERDLIQLRTEHRDAEVFLYPTRATPAQVQSLFADMMGRVNKLAVQPEFYDTVTNNCTTNIVRHINKLRPGRIQPWDVRVLLPGYSDQLAYELGLLNTDGSFLETRQRAKINHLAHAHRDAADFSQQIRRR